MQTSLRVRSLEPEILDDLETSEPEVRDSLVFMSHVNRYLGGIAAVTSFLENNLKKDDFTVLDLGTGSGDIPAAIARWAKTKGKRVRVTGVDVNPHCLAYAARRYGSDNVRFLQKSAFETAELGRFDYIISSMFFHHLDDAEIVRLLQGMAAQAAEGLLVNDLERGLLSCWGAALVTTGLPAVVRNDAVLSVKRGFRLPELENFARQAGLAGFRVERRPLFRVLLSWHRLEDSSAVRVR